MPLKSKYAPQVRRRTPRRLRRRAAAMAAVLVCLLVIMLIGTTLVRGMLLQQRQATTEARQLQALWLAESAAALARARLHDDPEYVGETWRPTIDPRAGAQGIVEIVVQRMADQPRGRTINITSTFPDDPLWRVVLDNQIIVTLPASGDPE